MHGASWGILLVFHKDTPIVIGGNPSNAPHINASSAVAYLPIKSA